MLSGMLFGGGSLICGMMGMLFDVLLIVFWIWGLLFVEFGSWC